VIHIISCAVVGGIFVAMIVMLTRKQYRLSYSGRPSDVIERQQANYDSLQSGTPLIVRIVGSASLKHTTNQLVHGASTFAQKATKATNLFLGGMSRVSQHISEASHAPGASLPMGHISAGASAGAAARAAAGSCLTQCAVTVTSSTAALAHHDKKLENRPPAGKLEKWPPAGKQVTGVVAEHTTIELGESSTELADLSAARRMDDANMVALGATVMA